MSSFDPQAYKQQQQRVWTEVAPAWQRWEEPFERAAAAVTRRLVELAAIRPGQRVLDLGTGLGEPALSISEVVGPAGRVVGIDLAEPMLAVARARAAASGRSNVELIAGDAESVPVQGPFGAVVSRWGLMFLPDVRGVLARARGWLSPGGRLAAAVWSTPDKVPMIALTFGVVARVLGLPPPPPGTPSPFCLADGDALAKLVSEAGFTGARVEPMDVAFELDGAETFLRYSTDVLPPFVKAKIEALAPAEREGLWREVKAAAARFAGGRGTLELTSRALLVSAAAGEAP